MKNIYNPVFLFFIVCATTSCEQNKNHSEASSPADHSIQHHAITTPDEALAEMKSGNQRFLDDKPINTDYKQEIEHTKSDQHPHTLVLTCMDSRVPPEIIFDQGIGNIFVVRDAGEVEDPNVLGSIEYATGIKGTKLIIVMGHANCGAIKGAVEKVELGNLTQLVHQIDPAITGDTTNMDVMLDETSKKNVTLTIADILNYSPVINEQVKEGKVKIVGAYYDVASGKVVFFE